MHILRRYIDRDKSRRCDSTYAVYRLLLLPAALAYRAFGQTGVLTTTTSFAIAAWAFDCSCPVTGRAFLHEFVPFLQSKYLNAHPKSQTKLMLISNRDRIMKHIGQAAEAWQTECPRLVTEGSSLIQATPFSRLPRETPLSYSGQAFSSLHHALQSHSRSADWDGSPVPSSERRLY